MENRFNWLKAELENLADPAYLKFHSRLVPGTSLSYGIQIPKLRKLAKEILKQDNPHEFLAVENTDSYEETIIKALVIAGLKTGFFEKLVYIENFLPSIDNWAVCDTFCTAIRISPKEESEVLQYILPLFSDTRTYYARFAIVMFLAHFTKEGFISAGLSELLSVKSEEYYVQMAAAWAVSVCFVKDRESTISFLAARQLPKFTQNKSIQKIRESLRVSPEDKKMVLAYKID